MTFPGYFALQWKRIVTILPAVILTSGLLLLAVFIIGRGFFVSDAENASKQTVRIGIGGNYEDTFLELAVTALQNLDSSRFSMDLVRLPEEEAKKSLRDGRLDAYVVIPEDFFESVDYYRNDVQITYVSTQGAVGIGTVMINELAESIGSLLLESENAVYGMQSYARDYYGDVLSDQQISDLGYAMTELYGLVIFSREKLFEIHETGLSDAMSFRGYYLCAMIVLFLLLIGIPFAPLFSDRDHTLFRLLSVRGIHYWQQVLAEYLAYSLSLCVLAVIFMPLLLFLLSKTGMTIPELSAQGSAVWLFLTVLLSIFPVSAVQFILYEIFSGAVPGILIQIMAALSAAYVSGCFYPISYLPESMQKTAAFLPAGNARMMLENALKGHLTARGIFFVLLWIIVCAAAAALKRAGKLPFVPGMTSAPGAELSRGGKGGEAG